MASANVSNEPLKVVAEFYPQLENVASQNGHYQQIKAPLTEFLSLIPPALQALLTPLQPYLNDSLGSIFNKQWASVLSSEETAAAKAFGQSAGSSVNTVTCSFPSSGTLVATTMDAQPMTVISPARPPTLTLDFLLPGSNFNFESGSITAFYNLNFDATLSVNTPVPVQPFGLEPAGTLNVANASLHAGDFGADLVDGLDDFFTGAASFFTQGNFTSQWDEEQVTAPELADGSTAIAASQLGAFLTLLKGLNAAGPELLKLGFTQCAFSIENGNTLTLTITHPLDPGPELEDPNSASAPILRNPPSITATETNVKPGQVIQVTGQDFLFAASTEIPLEWPNTSSGSPTGAQIQWCIKGDTLGAPVSIPLSAYSTNSHLYTHTVSSLTPGREHQFWARCGDSQTWSEWSKSPLTLSTNKTDDLELVLKPKQGTATSANIATKTLSSSSSSWSVSATIPASTAPGAYTLSAELSGAVLASMDITVATTLAPSLAIIDSANGAILPNPLIANGQSFTVRGENFPEGAVEIAIPGASSVSGNAVAGKFEVSLHAPAFGYDEVTVTATSGNLQEKATTTFQLPSPLK